MIKLKLMYLRDFYLKVVFRYHTQKKNYDHFRKVMFSGPKNFWPQVQDTWENPLKMGKYEVKKHRK